MMTANEREQLNQLAIEYAQAYAACEALTPDPDDMPAVLAKFNAMTARDAAFAAMVKFVEKGDGTR